MNFNKNDNINYSNNDNINYSDSNNDNINYSDSNNDNINHSDSNNDNINHSDSNNDIKKGDINEFIKSKILYIADIISVGPIAILLGLTYISLLNFRFKEIKLVITLILVNMLVTFIKRLPYPDSLYQITRRPKESINCDYLSRNGKQSLDAPGFPSGHMATLGFFATYQIYQGYSIPANLIIVLLTGWARWYKSNHNLLQITVGTLLGSLLSILYLQI